jgi:hypothetical protein
MKSLNSMKRSQKVNDIKIEREEERRGERGKELIVMSTDIPLAEDFQSREQLGTHFY